MRLSKLTESALLLLSIMLVLAGCSGDEKSQIRGDDEAFVFISDSPFADSLKRCVLVQTAADSCTQQELPALGLDGEVTHERIMDRVLVTHNWMGNRFYHMLSILPKDIQSLFGAVTAIYIGSTVRPSYYSTLNGAIHLDPAYLWINRDEKKTIETAEDFRSDYGADLKFEFFRRFVRDQAYAWRSYSLLDDSVRRIIDIEPGLARLLYHELAHANDFLPYSTWSSIDRSMSFLAAVDSVRDLWIAAALDAQYPLASSELKSLADVRYVNATPTSDETEVTADYAGSLMQNDGANYFYGYFTPQEDLAGLFTAAMMKLNYDVDADIAFISKPETESSDCADYRVGWGARGRLQNPLVAARTRFVANGLLPDASAVENLLDEISGSETLMRPGDSWCQNLILSDDISARSRPDSVSHNPMSHDRQP